MKLEINHSYVFVINVNGRILTFLGKVTDIDSMFVTFIDKEGKTCNYNLSNLISVTEDKR